MRVMVLRMNNKKAPFDNLNFRPRDKAMPSTTTVFIDGRAEGLCGAKNAGPIPVNLWGRAKGPAALRLQSRHRQGVCCEGPKAEGAPVDREIEIHIQQPSRADHAGRARFSSRDCARSASISGSSRNLWPQLVSSTAKRATPTPDMWVPPGCRRISSIRRNWIGQMYDSQFHGTWKASCWYKNEKVDTLLRQARRLRGSGQAARRSMKRRPALSWRMPPTIWIYNAIGVARP